jgi:uncharacterized protein (DUF1501 family)
MNRRDFLKTCTSFGWGGLALVGSPWPGWMPRLAFSPDQGATRGDILVVIFLRGAADALNIVIPYGEDNYYHLRPSLGIPRPDDHRATPATRCIDLDGFFGIHPNMRSLMPAWQAGHLAVVHACGAPDESRSHFKSMELMERGVTDERGPASGWISRHLATLDTQNLSPLRALGFGNLPQRSLSGSVPISAFRSITDFHFGADECSLSHLREALSLLYRGNEPLSVIGQENLKLLDALQSLDPQAYHPSGESSYPDTEFGLGLKQIAMLIKGEIGLEVAAIDLGGWDTHFAQGASQGLMPNLILELSEGLAALHADLIDHASNLTIVTMSEFGRRVKENGSLGTDHGHGGMMVLMGGNLNGGRVHGSWPGLGEGQLFGPGDLAVTTDYRDVLAEICLKRLNNPSLEEIFPGYTPQMRGITI